MNDVKDWVFWIVVFGFLIGVAVEFIFPTGMTGMLATGIIALGIGVLLWRDKRHVVYLCAGLLCAAALGIARADMSLAHMDHSLDTYVGNEFVLQGIVVVEPDERERTVRLVIKNENGTRVIASVPKPVDVEYGQRIELKGVLEKPDAFSADGGRIFNYPAYLAKDGIFYELKFPKVEIIGERVTMGFGKAYLYWLKQKYLEGLANALPEPHAALAGGITVGDKRALGGSLLDLFRATGIVHIVVLSGYNITIVAESVRRVLSIFPKRIALWASGIVISLFVLMTGASATGVRAGAMASLALAANATGRRYAITRALALTAVAMVLWSPYVLLYDPGFQLSVIATIGLIHVAPLIEKYLVWVTERMGLRGIVAATLGTQIAVLPLLLYHMGLFSLVALPVNLLVLPAIPAAMFASIAAGVVGLVSSVLGIIVAAPAYLLLSYSLWITKLFGALPFASFSVGAFSVWWMFAAYAVIVALFIFVRSQTVSQPHPSSSF